MKRSVHPVGLFFVVSTVVSIVVTAAFAKEPSTIKEIMKKLHKGSNAPVIVIKKDLQRDNPPWEDIQQMAKDFVTFGEDLGKNDPPKGEKGSWEKLTKQYVENAKALDAAAQKKDKKAALAAQGKLGNSAVCGACHKAHKL